MAATARNRRVTAVLLGVGLLFASSVASAANDTPDARALLSQIATALSAGNAAAAMIPFAKSYPDYGKLRDYFEGLTGAFRIASDIDTSDEQDSGNEVSLTVHWTLALSDLQARYTVNKSADIEVKIARQGRKWKIVQFSPVDLFNPALVHPPKPVQE